jgi:protocatechuate 3,4-dioxygenase, beta subunit
MEIKNIFTISRRDFFKKSMLLSAGVTGLILPLLAQSGHTETNPETCKAVATPPLGEGPFYPIKNQEDKDNDLTLIKGSTQRAEGEIIYLYGQVTDLQCRPIQNAQVEIWQADTRGRYDHAEDPNVDTVDRNFQHWGFCQTDAEGRYEFITIMPSSYPAWGGWVRPSHVHFHVSKSGFHDLITQMFFADDPLHEQDRVLQEVIPHLQYAVIANQKNSQNNQENALVNREKNLLMGAKHWKFDIVLRRSPI